MNHRSTHEVVEAAGLLYAIGGVSEVYCSIALYSFITHCMQNDGSSSLNTVESYEPLNNKWVLITSMMLRRSSVGAAVIECHNLEHILSASKMDLTPNQSMSSSVISNASE